MTIPRRREGVGRRPCSRPRRRPRSLLLSLGVAAAVAVAAGSLPVAVRAQAHKGQQPVLMRPLNQHHCATCVAGQATEPSASAIERVLAYHEERAALGLQPDLGTEELRRLLTEKQTAEEQERLLLRQLAAEADGGDAWAAGDDEIPMHRRKLLHVSTAESTMLQNALMWKVNKEFADARSTLNEMRAKDELRVPAPDGKTHFGDGTYAKKIAQLIQRSKKLRGGKGNNSTSEAASSSANNSTQATNITTPVAEDSKAGAPETPASAGAGAPNAAGSTGAATTSPTTTTTPSPSGPGKNRYGTMPKVAHGAAGSDDAHNHQQQPQPQPQQSQPQPQKPQDSPKPTGSGGGAAKDPMGTNAMEIDIPVMVPGFGPDLNIGIPDPDSIGSGGVINAMPRFHSPSTGQPLVHP